jgi:hypothetical protein
MAALTFPLALGDFANQLRKMTVKFDLEYAQELSGLGGGQIIAADLAPEFWTADVALINMTNDDWRKVQAVFLALDGSINDFYLYDPRCAYPAYDPDGSKLGSNTITITNVDSAKQVDLAGFPNNYVLTPGDMFSFSYGAGNAYKALHMVVQGGTAGVGGNITNVEIRPYLDDPSLATPKTIDIIKPTCRMKIIPGSKEAGTARQMITTGMTFRCRQIP